MTHITYLNPPTLPGTATQPTTYHTSMCTHTYTEVQLQLLSAIPKNYLPSQVVIPFA